MAVVLGAARAVARALLMDKVVLSHGLPKA